MKSFSPAGIEDGKPERYDPVILDDLSEGYLWPERYDPVILDDLSEGYLWPVPPPLVIPAAEGETLVAVLYAPMPQPTFTRPRHATYAVQVSSYEWPPVFTGVRGTAVPEPATWALLIYGFGVTGAVLRFARSLNN